MSPHWPGHVRIIDRPPPTAPTARVASRSYGDAGYLSTGSAHGKLLTPTLDKMAAEGMSFTEACEPPTPHNKPIFNICPHPNASLNGPRFH